jgi:UDP-3-O-[3-hydroxymyristoyl] glucosamine N-acyltransferase
MRRIVLLSDIVRFLGDGVIALDGDINDKSIDCIAMFGESTSSSLDWVNTSREDKQHLVESSKSLALLVDESVEYSIMMQKQEKVLIRVPNPRVSIGMIGNQFFVVRPKPGIHRSAVIKEDVQIHPTASIGANSVLGKCIIGKGSVIHNNVTINDGVLVGDNVEVFSGSVLGTNGLGCFRDYHGELQMFPHLGRLLIENDVVIGANCSIARGSLSDTIIGRGTKINALCFIAHNCIIGKNVFITGSSMLNGSVRVGDDTIIYSQVIVRDQAVIGSESIIGMGSVVTKDIPSNEVWVGNPARFLRKNEK